MKGAFFKLSFFLWEKAIKNDRQNLEDLAEGKTNLYC